MLEDSIWRKFKKIGINEIARQMGLSRQSIYKWKNSTPVPDSRLLDLEKITKIPRHRLKPSLFKSYRKH